MYALQTLKLSRISRIIKNKFKHVSMKELILQVSAMLLTS